MLYGELGMDTARGDLEEYVETLLMRADKRVLRSLAPTYRCAILVLRQLVHGPSRVSDLNTMIESRGFQCRSLGKVINMLIFYDFVSCSGKGDEKVCSLTQVGFEMASALVEFVESLRSFTYSVLDGTATENDIVANLATSMASTIGLVESYIEEPSLAPLYIPIHMYITGLSTAIIAVLARIDARVLHVVRSLGFKEQ
jgi:hypothetical protein